MPFNFSNVEVQKEKYVRTAGSAPRGQSFLFKFRPYLSKAGQAKAEEAGAVFEPKLVHEFRLSDKYMEELDVQNHSMGVLYSEGGVAIAVTPESYPAANFFVKKGDKKKGPLFNHHFLMIRLAEADIIQVPEVDAKGEVIDTEDELLGVNQYLDLKYLCDVESIIEKLEGGKKNPDYMVEVSQGEGIAIYEVVRVDGPIEGVDPEQDDDDSKEEE